jgi:hypothetical protein
MRIPSEDWVLVKTPREAIELLRGGMVTHLSLDHDLGLDDATGYDVLLWLEEAVALEGFTPPKILVHSSNPSARVKMLLAIRNIEKIYVNHN